MKGAWALCLAAETDEPTESFVIPAGTSRHSCATQHCMFAVCIRIVEGSLAEFDSTRTLDLSKESSGISEVAYRISDAAGRTTSPHGPTLLFLLSTGVVQCTVYGTVSLD